jgi:hypothetical protein
MTITATPTVPETVVERRYPKWLITLVSLGTALYVVAQLGAGLTLRTSTYPVVAFPMFADSPTVDVEPVVTVVTADGVTHPVMPHDVGLTADQLKFFVQRKIAANNGTIQMGAQSHMQFLGQQWAKKYGNPALKSVSLTFDEHLVDGSGRVNVVPMVTWKAASS